MGPQLGKMDLDVLCKSLESCPNRLCKSNEIVCAKRKIQEYADGDINNLLQLKAQINYYNATQNNLLDFVIKCVTVISFALTIIYNFSNGALNFEYVAYAFFAMVGILVLCIMGTVTNKRVSRKKQWVIYIDIVVDELIKDFEKDMKKNS